MKETAEITIDNLLTKAKYYYPNDMDIIKQAFDLANHAHEGQLRASGRPYITHPAVVCDILIDLGMDVPCLCAALLHDTVEDTYVTDEILRKDFGDEVADLVKGVTKLDTINFASKEEEQAENIRKMFFAMAKDIRILIIKLADRLHNMRSLEYLSEQRQLQFAKETLDIYAPLAGRLGISQIKCELEDSAMKFLDRPMYDYLASNISLKREERQAIVDEVILKLEGLLKELSIDGEVSGRTKHFYSIYKKIMFQGRKLEQIYDLTAVRVIVPTVRDCYAVLGTIHSNFKPITGRFKDYIAAPKPNLYQSIHTTVLSTNDMPFEIQIRTFQMHRTADYGIAAHWKYKEGKAETIKDRLKWVNDVLSYEVVLKNSTEFLDIIRNDLSISNQVYIFTPKGEIRMLTQGANVLDFAYHVHSEVGNHCVGAKLNEKICPLDTVLSSGDIVEILTSNNSKGPSRDWLKIVKTSSAKTKIRQFFKRELKIEYVKNGKSMLEKEAKNRGYNLQLLMSPEGIKAVIERYLFESLDDMYASIGYGGVSVNQILAKLVMTQRDNSTISINKITTTKAKTDKINPVMIKGHTDLLIRFSKCCSPVPGDEIIGFISRGRGVTIHRADCSTIQNLAKERLIEAEWINNTSDASFSASVQIISEDKYNVFADITKVIANEGLSIVSIDARKDKNNNAVATISVLISNNSQLTKLMDKIKALPSTIKVIRTVN